MLDTMRTRYYLLLLTVWATAAFSQPQQVGPDLDADKVAIAEHMSKIHWADSVGDAIVAARTRIMLAPLVRPAQARKLYAEAVLIADTAGLAGDEALRAHNGLMELNGASGNWRGAFEEARKVIDLTDQWNERQAGIIELASREELDRVLGQRDSLKQLLIDQGQRTERSLASERSTIERWRWTSLLLGVMALLVVLGAFATARKERRRTRVELGALRAELDEVRAAIIMKPVAPAPPVVPPPVVAVPLDRPVVPVPEAPDDLVLGMFRAQAPKRLETLRMARSIGDTEKVVRVVHSLKPQLVHIDAQRFTALCGALTAAGAVEQTVKWNADLDRFEMEVSALLG